MNVPRDRLPPLQTAPGRRTVSRPAVEEMLLVSGYLFEARAGSASSALPTIQRMLGAAPGAAFDPDEVINAMIVRGLRGEDDFWRDRYVATGRRLAVDLCGSTGGGPPDVRNLAPRPFRIEFRRTFDLARAPARRLRAPLPIEDAHLSDLTVAIEESEADIRVQSGRLETRVAETERGRVEMAATFSFVAHPGLPHGLKTGLARPESWLADREGPIQVTRAVTDLAARLTAGVRDPFDQVMALRNHLIDTMACGRISLERLDGQTASDWVLAHRWFDCRLGAALLAALCRACRIPARLVGGFLLWDAPSEHYWMEAWLPDRGWTPFDLLAWDLSAGGQDADWRNVFAGSVDYRMKTQVFPDIFTGAPGVPMGEAWHRLLHLTPGGLEASLVAVPDGGLIYADRVTRLTD